MEEENYKNTLFKKNIKSLIKFFKSDKNKKIVLILLINENVFSMTINLKIIKYREIK